MPCPDAQIAQCCLVSCCQVMQNGDIGCADLDPNGLPALLPTQYSASHAELPAPQPSLDCDPSHLSQLFFVDLDEGKKCRHFSAGWGSSRG